MPRNDKGVALAVPFDFEFVERGHGGGGAPRAAQARRGKARLERAGIELLKGMCAPVLVGRAALGPWGGGPLLDAAGMPGGHFLL